MSEEIKENFVKKFYHEHHDLLWEIFRFLLVGGFATLVDWGVSFLVAAILPDMFLFSTWNFKTVISTGLGFIVGLFVNYFLSIVFVFKNKKDENEGKSLKDFALFALIGVLVLLFQILGIFLIDDLFFTKGIHFTTILIGNLTWSYIIAKVVMTAVGLVLNYVFRKIFIFK